MLEQRFHERHVGKMLGVCELNRFLQLPIPDFLAQRLANIC